MKLSRASAVVLLIAGLNHGAHAGLINGGFEVPVFCPGGNPCVSFPLEGSVPGWQTTATDNVIEIWSNGFNGVVSYEGNQHAELNATQVSTLFQDAAGIAGGSIVGFQFAHRGRGGVDTMRFTLTDLGTDDTFGTGDDSVLFTNLYSDGLAWGFYSGSGIIALGNTVRFSFIAVSAAGGPTVGNFLDATDFGVGVGVPEPASALLLGLGVAALGARRWKKSVS